MWAVLRVIDGEKCFDVPIADKKRITIGSGLKNTYVIADSDIKKKHITVRVKKGKVIAKFKGEAYLGNNPVRQIEIAPGQTIMLSRTSRKTLTALDLTDECKNIDLNYVQEVSIGRESSNNIVLSNRRVSGAHAKIYCEQSEYHIADMNSTNGTYVNGNAIEDAILKNNDEIVIEKYTFVFADKSLVIKNSGKDILVHNIQKHERDLTKRPIFNRSPRLRIDVTAEELEIQAAPTIGTKPEINWLSTLLPGFGMVGVMLLVAILSGGNMMSLMYTAPMSLIGVIVSVSSYNSQKKKHKNMEKARVAKYTEYIAEKTGEIEANIEKQLKTLTHSDPETSECFDIARNIERRLWERKPSDADFVSFRIGSGDTASSLTIKVPNKNLTIEQDEFENIPFQLRDKYKIIHGIPVCYDAKNNPTCGIIGDRRSALRIVRNMVVQAATQHSYTELKIVTVFSKREKDEFLWMRWLPHSFDDDKSVRYMADTQSSATELFKYFDEVLKQREIDLKNNGSYHVKTEKIPHYLFIIGGREFTDGQQIMRRLVSNNPELGVSTIFLFDEMGRLPDECSVIIEAKNGTGEIYGNKNASFRTKFLIDDTPSLDFEEFARNLAPIQIPASADSSLPSCVTFLEGYGVKTPSDIDVEKYWKNARTFKSLAVPIGVKVNGEKFIFDIHEKVHGPHGLVAGTTGSGKSEMVQSWILSMAIHFPPSAVSFVLIDFKGTGLILPFLNMPHLAGTISDLDKNITRNLIALENELARRKNMLDDAGVSNINAYLKLYYDNKVSEPMPYLFIVIDEFAEFKSQFPDFGKVIDSILRTGRTLGVFSILLMQKPAGVVSEQSESNVKFRWCLKVAQPSDSREMIGTGDAAQISNAGRAYVKVSNEGAQDYVYEQIQSFWSGAPYNPNRKEKATVKPRISALDLSGKRIAYDVREMTTGFKSDINEIEVIVKELQSVAKETGGSSARQIWSAKLSNNIPLSDFTEPIFDGEKWQNVERKNTLAPLIGMVDDPRNQTQYPLKVNFSEDGHTVVYGAPGSGKTTLLQTLVMSVCTTYRPDEVSIYIMDFGGWNMGLFRDFPHVGGVANDNESDKIEKLVRLISKELESRKRKFAEEGVGNIRSYREISKNMIPFILLVLDNFAPVFNLYPNLEDFFITLSREGGNYGVYLMTVANNQMSMGYKISQNIKNAIALQLTDKSDYPSIVGRTEGLEPEKNPGRGLVKGVHPLEFQTALPIRGASEGERALKIRGLAKNMSASWTGKRAKQIPIMPDIIPYGSVEAENIAIGLSSQDIESVEISFDESHCMIISGKPRSGKSNMLKVIEKQLDAKKLIVFDPSAALKALDTEKASYCTEAQDFDRNIAELVPELERRRKAFQSDASSEFERIGIIVDDWKQCFDSASEDTVKRLSAIVRIGRGLNVILIVAGNDDDITTLGNHGEQLTCLLTGGQQAILLGGCANDHDRFKISNLPYSERSAKLNENEGFLVIKENALRFKAMYEN